MIAERSKHKMCHPERGEFKNQCVLQATVWRQSACRDQRTDAGTERAVSLADKFVGQDARPSTIQLMELISDHGKRLSNKGLARIRPMIGIGIERLAFLGAPNL